MKKALRKYILTICTILLGGYGFVHAKLEKNFDQNKPGTILQKSEYVVSLHNSGDGPTIKYAITDDENDDQFLSEETDDISLKFGFARKTASASQFLISPFIQKLRYSFSENRKPLIFFQHLVNGSSRYLTFQVLRL